MIDREIKQRKTKILATLGPSSNTIRKIIELSKAGANAFRLNCSHLSEEELRDYVKKIRRVEELLKKPIGILVDLQGPKIRIGNIKNEDNLLEEGNSFIFDLNKDIGNSRRVFLPHKKIFSSVFGRDFKRLRDYIATASAEHPRSRGPVCVFIFLKYMID